MLPARARTQGDLGFKAGDWWINATFAFRDGIVDSPDTRGGVTSDSHKAYAILMTDSDELESPCPEKITYRTSLHDKGRYRLTSAARDSRHAVRVLRSHSLRSFWSPRAGIRYEGLYRVSGWSIYTERKTKKVIYDINLERLLNELPMETVLCRPFVAEVEDYKEFKRLRQVAKSENPQIYTPTCLFIVDGINGN